ncbi:MAG: hypothetical protein EOL87_16420, partial [Spartobacteria bacterium]|nr:hypothetical protein [Spartobacteria bacterium]
NLNIQQLRRMDARTTARNFCSIRLLWKNGESLVVEELRMFSRRGGDRKVKCSIDEPIRRALRLCNNALKYKITVQNQVDEAAPVVHMNVQLVEQVFVNLFKNAADAMAESTPALLSISYTKEEENVRILVRDTGPGIPTGKIDEIWTAFYTTKDPEKGTGLGLAISRDIILKHGGEIWVENLFGGGAQFSILLPLPANIRVPGECPDECEKA